MIGVCGRGWFIDMDHLFLLLNQLDFVPMSRSITGIARFPGKRAIPARKSVSISAPVLVTKADLCSHVTERTMVIMQITPATQMLERH
jgi:hypothetical protein